MLIASRHSEDQIREEFNYLRENNYFTLNTTELREWMEQLDRIQGLAKDFETLEEWLKYVENYTTQIQKVKKVTGDAVEIMTMHAAKGLEWKQVWIPDLNKGIIPH